MVQTAIPKDAKPPAEISDNQREELILLQEEERLAYEVYTKLGELYPLNPFKNIPRSEANHMEATMNLLTYHGISIPKETIPGKYESPELQKLYRKLLKRGRKSEIEALRVGALVEETDIRDLRKMAADPPSEVAGDLGRQLELASYNHLRAFVRNLNARVSTTSRSFSRPTPEPMISWNRAFPERWSPFATPRPLPTPSWPGPTESWTTNNRHAVRSMRANSASKPSNRVSSNICNDSI